MKITDGSYLRKFKSNTTQANKATAIKYQSSNQTLINAKQILTAIKPIKSKNKEATIPPLNLAFTYSNKIQHPSNRKEQPYDNNPYQQTDVSSIEGADDIQSFTQYIQSKALTQSKTREDKRRSLVTMPKLLPYSSLSSGLGKGLNMGIEMKIEVNSININTTLYNKTILMRGLRKNDAMPIQSNRNDNTEPINQHQYYSNTNNNLFKTQNESKTINSNDISSQDYSTVSTPSNRTNSNLLHKPSVSLMNTSHCNHRRTISLNLNSASSSTFQTTISYSDLLLIEENLHDILSVLTLNHSPEEQCLLWWTNYFTSSLKDNYIEYFYNETNKKKIKAYSTIELLSILLCYILSTNQDVLNYYLEDFKLIFTHLHLNYLLLTKYIIAKQKGNDNIYDKINLMIKLSLTSIRDKDIEEFFITSLIMHNVTIISEACIKIIENAFRDSDNEEMLYNYLYNAYINRQTFSSEELNHFLKEEILKEDFDKQSKSIKPKIPYLSINCKSAYTLVLDLDETLVHLIENIDDKPAIDIRPGLFEFLKKMKSKYELVLFTAGTQDYADTIITIIELKEKYFSQCLYREHTLVVNNEYIKDLWKLGRDLSKVIIIDDKPQNYQLQKENGILIEPFFGDSYHDTLGALGDILIQIYNDKGDVRDSLIKYKNEIMGKVTNSIK